MTVTVNPTRDPGWTCPPAPPGIREFHQGLPGYAPTPLTEISRGVFVKDESSRLGLPAFKALGASWAIHRAAKPGQEIVTATDGNHGRAVARFADRAHIFVPDGVPPAAIQAIRDEGATVTHVPGDYDEAVRAAADHAAKDDARLLVQDTSWPGYTEIPGWIVDGYSTLFAEMTKTPDLVIVPTGVGSLLQAALTHYRSDPTRLKTVVVSVEPVAAACVQASVAAGRPVTVDTGSTIMAGLNCGTVSALAWPYIAPGLDACVTVTDEQARAAAEELADLGIPAGPCGAASLAAAKNLKNGYETTVLLSTEGTLASGLVEDDRPGGGRVQ